MKNLYLINFLLFGFLISNIIAGDDWKKKSPSPKPTTRYLTSMAYISDCKLLLFGGYADGGDYYNDDTWIYNYLADEWLDKDPGTWISGTDKPTGRSYSTLAYIGDDKVLLFGGQDGSGNLNDTWIFDLSSNTWTNKDPGTWIEGTDKPAARRAHDMAWLGDDKVLLFGGVTSANTNETWIYDLSDNIWTDKDPGTWVSGTDKPTERSSHSCAHFGGNQVILFGGSIGSGLSNETWIYDLNSNSWNKKSPTSSPPVRYLHSMAFIGGDQVLIFGGYDWNLSNKYNDTWIFDFSINTWTQDSNSDQPTIRYGHAMAESSMDGTSYLVLFGGRIDDPVPGAMSDETWTFGGGDYPLPVELNSFTASIVHNNVELKWTTATEVNNYGFEVERRKSESINYNLEWKRIGFIQGHGNSNSPNYYSFTDNDNLNGIIKYRLKQIDIDGSCEYSDIVEIDFGLPSQFSIEQNYPNPFNPTTKINYALPEKSLVNLKIYDILGNLVLEVVDEEIPAGYHELIFDASKLSSGVYLYRIETEKFVETKKMILLR